MYTRKNAKLSHDMMVAILAPYIRAAMPSVSKVTISSDGLLILRQERRKWDRCVSLDVPLEVPVRSGRGKRYLNIVLRLLIRDDTNWLLDWECIEELPTGLEEKLEARVRAILRKSRNNAFRELLERWRWGGTLVGVKLSPEDFGMLVKVLAESYTY